MAEWSKAPVAKTGRLVRVSEVRILSPPHMTKNFEISANAQQEQVMRILAAQNQARTLLSGVYAGLSGRARIKLNSWTVLTSRDEAPGARNNDVHLVIRFGDIKAEQSLRVRVYIDHTIQNPDTYNNGTNFMMTAYLCGTSGNAIAYAMNQGWYRADGNSIATAIASSVPQLFA